jgi:hypothetical protein
MSKVKLIVLSVFFSMLILCGPLVMWVLAGNLDSPAGPTSAASAMYTLEAIYNRLDKGTPGSKRTGAFIRAFVKPDCRNRAYPGRGDGAGALCR